MSKGNRPRKYPHYTRSDYAPVKDLPARSGAEQHRLYKSTGYRVSHEKIPDRPGKWSPYRVE